MKSLLLSQLPVIYWSALVFDKWQWSWWSIINVVVASALPQCVIKGHYSRNCLCHVHDLLLKTSVHLFMKTHFSTCMLCHVAWLQPFVISARQISFHTLIACKQERYLCSTRGPGSKLIFLSWQITNAILYSGSLRSLPIGFRNVNTSDKR